MSNDIHAAHGDWPVQPTLPVEQAFSSLRRGVRLTCVALPAQGEMNVPIYETVLKGISIIGSIVGARRDLAEVFALHAEKKTRVIGESRRIEDVNASREQVLAGKIAARLVFEFEPEFAGHKTALTR